MVKLTGSGIVNFYCMQKSLVMSMRYVYIIFGDDWNDALSSSGFLEFRLFTHVLWSIQKHIVENDIKRKYREEYSTVDKVGIKKLLARKSCFV